jgi:phosphocarrier protein
MKQLILKVVNEVGLHARPATLFVRAANRYQSTIRLRNITSESRWADAKSILGVLTLGVEKNHEIELQIEGPDEDQAALSLSELILTDYAGSKQD